MKYLTNSLDIKEVLTDITWIKRELLLNSTLERQRNNERLIIETARPGNTCASVHFEYKYGTVWLDATWLAHPRVQSPLGAAILWDILVRAHYERGLTIDDGAVSDSHLHANVSTVNWGHGQQQGISGWCADWGNVGRGLGVSVCPGGDMWKSGWVFRIGCMVESFVQDGGCLVWRGVDTANAVKWSAARSRGLGGGGEGWKLGHRQWYDWSGALGGRLTSSWMVLVGWLVGCSGPN